MRCRWIQWTWITVLAIAGEPVLAWQRGLPVEALPANVVVPQTRAFALDGTQAVQIRSVIAGVEIREQVAVTTVKVQLHNPTSVLREAVLLLPLPDDAVIHGFAFDGAAGEPTAQILSRQEARKIYDAIVRRSRDPALLELIGYRLARSIVFPVPPAGEQKIRLTYESLLAVDGDRVDYLLPRSELLQHDIPWQVSVKIISKGPIATVYSPSHAIQTRHVKSNVVWARLKEQATTQPGPFRLSFLRQRGEVTASLLAYPDPAAGGGYFLLLAGMPPRANVQSARPTIKREVTLALDRSGSMQGAKLAQVRAAAARILTDLEDGEAFNIIAYHEGIDLFAESAVVKSPRVLRQARQYLNSLSARGGTNIHDALLESLRVPVHGDRLPMVLFLTDGLPTVGRTSEAVIGRLAQDANPYQRRVFTVGVGVDVNAPLLQRLADQTRARATFILPGEDIEERLGRLFERLAHPVLAEPRLRVLDNAGAAMPRRVRDLLPVRLPDLCAGDQLVVLGRYQGRQPITFAIAGNYQGTRRELRFTFALDKATTRNAFVPRLWASRRIANLIDAIRQLGAENGTQKPPAGLGRRDPKAHELVTEVVKLSTRFGVLSEYTAFLAREGTDLSRPDHIVERADKVFRRRAIQTRSGLGAVNQSINNIAQQSQSELNLRNRFFDETMTEVSVTNVQQVADQAFYRRGLRWLDSRVLDRKTGENPQRVIQNGSEEFHRLSQRLQREGREGIIALADEVVTIVDGQPVLIKNVPERR